MSNDVKCLQHIVQAPMDYSLCTGCASCEMVCSLTHDGCVSKQRTRIFFDQDNVKQMVHEILSCQQCEDHPCYDACPKQGEAMMLDEQTGVVYIVEEECIGCGKCVKACRFEHPRINLVKSKDKTQRKAKKCDLCRGNPDGPQCIAWCPARVLALSGEEPWLGHGPAHLADQMAEALADRILYGGEPWIKDADYLVTPQIAHIIDQKKGE